MYKIIILDDESNHLFATKRYLQLHGFNVFATDSPKKALELIKRSNPQLLIVDVIMPLKDGYEFIRDVKLDPMLEAIPFIFLTAKGLTQDRIKGYKLGCHAYIAKPFNPEELIAIINNIMNQQIQRNRNIKRMIKRIKMIRIFLENQHSILNIDSSLRLTAREHSVLYYVLKGFKNKDIACKLKTSLRTIEKHISRLLSKTETNTRTELISFIYFHKVKVKANDGDRTRE